MTNFRKWPSALIKLENPHLIVHLEPSMGGRILSVLSKPKGHELLFQAQAHHSPPSSPRNAFAPFAYGWDDCFPSVISAGLDYPDHGLFWGNTASTLSQTEDFVQLYLKHKKWEIVKRLRLLGSTLHIEIDIRHHSTIPSAAFFTTHLLARFEEGMRLFPEIIYQDREYAESSSCEFNERMQGPNGTSRKWWLKPEAFPRYFSQGATECGIHYPNLGMKYTMEWEQNSFPYLGVWVTSGEFQGDRNLAWEISDGYFDSLEVAERNQRLPSFQTNQTKTFAYQVKWEVSS